MPRRTHPYAASSDLRFPVETGADSLPVGDESGVRALPSASLPPLDPRTLGRASVTSLPRPTLVPQARVSLVPSRPTLVPQVQLDLTALPPSDVSQRILLERAQRKARIKQAAAEASIRLAALFREEEEKYREEMIWREKLREAKQKLKEEAEWKATVAAAQLQQAIAQQRERALQEEAEWEAAIAAARNRQEAPRKVGGRVR